MVSTVSNPLELNITSVIIQKFDKSESLNIFPQFVEFILYQSIFEPVMKAELLVNDNIGLFTNWPFTGEETVSITYKTLTGIKAISTTDKTMTFVIRGVKNIVVDDRARSMMFVVELTSVEFLQNTRKYVSHAYSDLIENMAENLYNEYIRNDTQSQFGIMKPFNKEETTKIRSLIVPNLRPFQAIQWLAKHAISKNYDKHYLYLFYEDLDSFNFVTLQKLIEDGLLKRADLMSSKYIYTSDSESTLSTSNTPQDPEASLRIISNLIINKRFSSIEKIASGYYQNELFEISMLQKSYNSTLTELIPAMRGENFVLEPNFLNTKSYINYVKNEKNGTEYSNRIRYIINNYEDTDSQGKSQPEYRLKIGKALQYLIALNQIDLTATVPANMELKAGQIIYVSIPENHGFNEVGLDQYISGLFLISEVKQVITAGNRATTSIRIYKDGYLNSLQEKSNYYNTTYRSGDYTINPSTGRFLGGV